MSTTESPQRRYAVAHSKDELLEQLKADQQDGQPTTLMLDGDDSLIISFRATSTLHENDRDIIIGVTDQNKDLNIHVLHNSAEVFIVLNN